MTDPIGPIRAAVAGRYEIEREIGQGAFATVYLARDLRHDRLVAFKVLNADPTSENSELRFLREIRLLAKLQHPNILPLIDSGHAEAMLYYVMPYVKGESLRDRIHRERQLPLEAAIAITREAADALACAHEQGIIHRDIKPENILLSAGHPMIADFGVARAIDLAGVRQLTRTGLGTPGTPAYMSPEQMLADGQIDQRTDIYSLGCVLYEMLTGKPPFAGKEGFVKRFTEPPPLPSTMRRHIPAALDTIVSKALSRDRKHRYATASEFAQALSAPLLIESGLPASRDAVISDHMNSVCSPAPGLESPLGGGAPNDAEMSRAMRMRAVRAGLGAAGLVLLLGIAWAVVAHARRLAAAGADAPRMLAVLPFENLGKPDEEYFADGMSDEVRSKLATLPDLRVIARASSAEYKGTRKDPNQIARELGVQYLLSGTVRWERDATGQRRVRVTPELVQMTDAPAPVVRWQQQLDADLRDVFGVQTNIARQVAESLGVVLAARDRTRLATAPTRSLDAYDAYLQGRDAWGAGTQWDPSSLRGAVSGYEKAVRLDPTFALAWAGLADVRAQYQTSGSLDPTNLAQAKVAAERAVALAPGLAEAHIALGNVFRISPGDDALARARAQYEIAYRLDPHNPTALLNLAGTTGAPRYSNAGLAQLHEAATLDPRSLAVAHAELRYAVNSHRIAEGRAAGDRALALRPESLTLREWRAMVELQAGDLAAARAVLHRVPATVDPDVYAVYVATYWDLYWVLDSTQQASVLRSRPSAFDSDTLAWGLALAEIWALRGDRAHARAYADSARRAGEHQLERMPNDGVKHAALGVALAYMGRADEAVSEGEHATALTPVGMATVEGYYVQHQLVRIHLLLGHREQAIDTLEPLLRMPYPLTPAWLRVDPTFAPIRSVPRLMRLTSD